MQVGNVGGKEFSESLAPDVQKLLVNYSFVMRELMPAFGAFLGCPEAKC